VILPYRPLFALGASGRAGLSRPSGRGAGQRRGPERRHRPCL